MDGECSTHREEERYIHNSGNLRERGHLENLSLDERVH